MPAVFRGLFVVLIAVAVVAVPQQAAQAQLSTASINGVVRDPSSAVVPNATIVLHAVDTGVERTTTTNGSGEYVFSSITPGSYTLDANGGGFSPQKLSAFVLTVGQTATFDFA